MSAEIDWATIELVRPGDLAVVPSPVHRRIEPGALAAYKDQAPIAQIISGAVEIAKKRGYCFLTHRAIASKLDHGVEMLGYSLSLAIVVAAGPVRAMSLCATVIQVAGARVVLRAPKEHSPETVKDAADLLNGVLGL